ncbi:unnamed protein product, partial [Protopolystoma xenopodis]
MNPCQIVELNVGGQGYTTSRDCLLQDPDSHLASWFTDETVCQLPRDGQGRVFIDRDGLLFRYILDYLRQIKANRAASASPPGTGTGSGLVGRQSCSGGSRTDEMSCNAELVASGGGADVDGTVSLEANQSGVQSSTGLCVSSSSSPLRCHDNSQAKMCLSPSWRLSTAQVCSTAHLPFHRVLLPDGFTERARLREEAAFYGLAGLVDWLDSSSPHGYSTRAARGSPASTITLTYRGSLASGRDGLADIKFRKLTRILVCGKGSCCREVFGESLNDSRDPDHGGAVEDRYSSRYFLKHSVLELAFDCLLEAGYR